MSHALLGTPEELKANHQGRLLASQWWRARMAHVMVFIWFGGLATFADVSSLGEIHRPHPGSVKIALAITFTVIALVLLVAVIASLIDLARGRVASVVGVVGIESPPPYVQSVDRRWRVGNLTLRGPLVAGVDGERCRVYYLPRTRSVVAAERPGA
jgi:hypothetical protein